MSRAIELARRGLGSVEPNPAVGAVLVDDGLNLLGEGWHGQFGGPHAEVNAFADFQQRHPEPGDRAESLAQATLFVTLEPCCHTGKTPPCTDAILTGGVQRVVIGIRDPSPHVNGGGLTRLEQAGIEVRIGLLEAEVRDLNAPFLKRLETGLPYVHAKWAMTLDGKIATKSGSSQWISNEESRARVHKIRGRMDAVVIGTGTAGADDPMLTARPSGPRTATRIVVDSQARLSLESTLVQTAAQTPVLVAALDSAPPANVSALQAVGVEVLLLSGRSGQGRFSNTVQPDLRELLLELGRRGMTNVLVEGGSRMLGSLFDLDLQERRRTGACGLASRSIPAQVLALVPEEYAREHTLLPVRLAGDTLSVAVEEPQTCGIASGLKSILDRKIEWIAADRIEIEAAIERHYSGRLRSAATCGSGHGLIDAAHVFIAPKFVGDAAAMGPIDGIGIDRIPQECQIDAIQIETLDGDVYIHGSLVRRDPSGLK
ncbi:MAG: bifunctional diaminohydroxyphosphoribosylaminopyrimidine deaminase/5-amino-6-(5-phosphoribosylamino)uracil reductase RibD [Planctomycetaceae bacterium]